jgi:hypothetical protein
MEAFEKKRDDLLDSFDLPTLRSFFIPPSSVASLKRDTLIRKLKEIPVSPPFIERLRSKLFRTRYIPDYGKITVDELKEMYKKRGLAVPKGTRGLKGVMYKEIFGVEPPASSKKKVLQVITPENPAGGADAPQVEIPSEERIPRLSETSERDLLILLSLRGITFSQVPAIQRLYELTYFPRKLRRETMITVSRDELNELLQLNYLVIPRLYPERLELLNKFAKSYFVEFQLGPVEKATRASFPANFVSEFPALYSTGELKRIAKLFLLDRKENKEALVKKLPNYTITFPEIVGRTEDDLKTRADVMALINERVRFTVQMDESFQLKTPGQNPEVVTSMGEAPPPFVYFVLSPQFVYAVTLRKLTEEYTAFQGLEFKAGEVSDPDSAFRKTLDVIDVESLKRLTLTYPDKLGGIGSLIRQIDATKKLLKVLPTIDARPKTKLLKIHEEAFGYIEDGAREDIVPDYLAVMYEDFKGFSFRFFTRFLKRAKMDQKAIAITERFISFMYTIETPLTSIDILGLLEANVPESIAEIIVKFTSRDLSYREPKRQKKRTKIKIST